MNQLRVSIYKRRRATTWPRITMGEFDVKAGHLRIFLPRLREIAARITAETGGPFRAALKELTALTLLHEMHHAMRGNDSRERAADLFAVKAYRLAFGRAPKYGAYWLGKRRA